jgi:hypothetical protein
MNQFKLKIGGEQLRIETTLQSGVLARYTWRAECTNYQGNDPVAYGETEARAIEKLVNLIADFQQLTRET